MTLEKLIKRLQMVKKPEMQRELLLDAWSHCDDFFVGLQLSCDPTTEVVVKKIVNLEEDDGHPGTFTFKQFLTLYDQVTQVGADPEVCRALIIDAAMEANYTEWNGFYRKILLKKLQADMPMEVIGQVLSELTGIPIVL